MTPVELAVSAMRVDLHGRGRMFREPTIIGDTATWTSGHKSIVVHARGNYSRLWRKFVGNKGHVVTDPPYEGTTMGPDLVVLWDWLVSTDP